MQTKDVTLPSGLKVTIRRPGGLLLQDMARNAAALSKVVPDDETNDEAQMTAAENRLWLMFRCIARCTVEPQYHDKVDEDGFPVEKQGRTHVDSLDRHDLNKLFEEIWEFSGMMEVEDNVRPLSKTGTD